MWIAEIIQTAIHKLEVGAGARILKLLALALVVAILALRYDAHAYKNMFTPEGMDTAQLARNISEGRGYTTEFVRPFSIYLETKFNQSKGVTSGTNAPDFARVKTAHPDLANAPVYPVMLAGLMKILPFHFALDLKQGFWNDGGKFAIYQPDFCIAIFNQILLLGVVALTFLIARKLFDSAVAWLSAVLVLFCNLLWQFSLSGMSTMFLLIIFLSLTWCLLKIEELAHEPQPNVKRIFWLAISVGILTGTGALTRYAFGWAIIPVAAFLVFFGGQRRVLHVLAAFGAFVIILTPWIVRNYAVSGTPFGTAGYAIAEDTFLFPRFELERSIHPNLTFISQLSLYRHKLWENGVGILIYKLPTLGEDLVSTFFLAGLLLQFRNVAVRRARYFLLMCLCVFVVVQALGQTWLSTKSPDINSENLLVLLMPLVFIYGVSLFYTLLDQMVLPAYELRYVVIFFFAIACCLPMRILLWTAKPSPVAYPPYYPPEIQQTAGWLKKNDLMMSDIPWAVAWYGDRQCLWLTLNAQNDFFAVNDEAKAIHALYLTPETMDAKFLTDWILPHEYSWGTFILQAVTEGQTPLNFPLRYAPPPTQAKYLPERLYLADAEYWKLRPDTVQ